LSLKNNRLPTENDIDEPSLLKLYSYFNVARFCISDMRCAILKLGEGMRSEDTA
jgi:hypothetical protein